MYRDSIISRILVSLLVVVSTAVAGALVWALADDYARREVMPRGASVDGVSIQEMDRAAATSEVESRVKGTLLSPATVRFKDRSFDLDPAGFARVDVEGMVSEALAPKREATLVDRVLERIGSGTLGREVARKMRVDEQGLGSWIAEVDRKVYTAAVNATLSVEATGLRVIPEIPGYRVATTEAVPAVSKALLAGEKNIALPVRTIDATVTAAKFGKMILVKISQRRLYLYDGPALVKTYSIAVGTGGHPTPKGWWKIVNKRYMPSWSNPAPTGWGAGMPPYIAPGPSNPLGTRALDLNASGIRIHGTTKNSSIGTAASHGCMRMHRWDIENLFPQVPVGTPVIITS
ncbi:MAG TPA: L,D-transpeptidase family protein [Coriobacteriia bacterium]